MGNRENSIPKKMPVVALAGKGWEDFKEMEMEVLSPGPRQLLARVNAVSVCASDVKIVEQGPDHNLLYGWDTSTYPIILGHEGSITAVEIGEELNDKYFPGDTFAVQADIRSYPIYHRERYRNNGDGIKRIAIGYTLPGLFAPYILITEEAINNDSLIPYNPKKIPYFGASLIEPVACVVASQNNMVHFFGDDVGNKPRVEIGVKTGGITLILGAGPMGLMNLEIAMLNKPRIIIVSEPDEERRNKAIRTFSELVKSAGISLFVTTPDEIHSVILSVTEGQGVDDCIVSSDIHSVQEEALSFVGKGGVVNLFGGLKAHESIIKVDGRRIHYEWLHLTGSTGSTTNDMKLVLRMIEEKKIDPGNYVGAYGGLNVLVSLVKKVKNREIHGKGIIYPWMHAPLTKVDRWSAEDERKLIEKNNF